MIWLPDRKDPGNGEASGLTLAPAPQIKGDGNASWTAFVAPQGKDGSVLPERSYMPPSTGLTSFGKKGPEEELLAGLTIEAGLNIPTVPEGQEPNLRSRMYRNKYPDVEETVVVLVKVFR